ncbi:MAG: M20/M25/M40 family metallo-hydrolase [Chloroflexi bacterium]|nr:M20/M25/M40 family metallo-hydrolase [Chloroflexota bacterium]
MTINWNSIRDETARLLQDLIRIDTTNPPGNETPAMEYVAGVLKRDGIESRILESAPGRGNLVARLKGDGRAAPLLLMVHLDVVPAEPAYWTHPPFGGEIADGYLYGRGALDTKNLAALEIMVMLLLAREKKSLARDVIFMANADEEAGGVYGAGWMVKNHPDLIRAEYAINEGGGSGMDIMGKRFYTCQTGEKGTARFVMRTRGAPGHGSMPHRDNAVVKLAHAVQQIGAAELPMRVVPTVKTFVEAIGSALGKPYDAALREVLDPKKSAAALQNLPLDDGMRAMLYASLHNTVSPTILKAGSKINVIPSVAEAECDARILPGQSAATLRAELKTILDGDVELEFKGDNPGRESSSDTPLFETMRRVITRHEPNATLLPYLVVGATDARHVSKLGTHVYGFAPMFAPMSEFSRIHGHDERISIENLEFGARVLYEVVSKFCSA